MIKQKYIKRWIPIADIIFKKYMPIDYLPPVQIGSPKTIMKIRTELVEMTQSLQVNPSEPYDSIMEMIHGDKGDAILIQQELLPECYGADNIFCHYYWHELGHYFAIRNEYPGSDLHRFNNPGLTDDRAKQEGYWFWSEFIAEAIADHVDELHCRIDNADIYRPETLTWEPEQWGCLVDRLLHYLDLAFEWSITSIDEAALAMFFATILMDDATRHYIRAAENAELKVYDQQLHKPVKMKPGSIEPTCISDAREPYQDMLWKIKELLEEQLRKKEFWKIDEDFLEEIGQCLLSLLAEKVLLEEAEDEEWWL
ncbi:MAG: hypothetical protein LUE92_16035 [Clostridiales bacterium]|nr:hypothetical protein [Clostridiales bacterium]